jgi:hypothetical protein
MLDAQSRGLSIYLLQGFQLPRSGIGDLVTYMEIIV